MDKRTLVLASTSAYRRELLARLKWPFEVVAPSVDESPRVGERPADTALRLSEAKARAVGRSRANALVIGSDQVADCDGVAVSKPVDADDAVRLLAALSGRTIVFHTGVALLDTTTGDAQLACVDVASTFRTLTRAQIDAYLEREQPYDCAGAVKSEALGIALFERIASDDPTALIGLPLIALTGMLRNVGIDVLAP